MALLAKRKKDRTLAANTQNNLENDNPKGKNGTPRKAIFAVILLAGIVFGGRYGYGKYTFGQSHVSTDDAYVTGDLVYVSPTINGLLVSLDIEEGSVVKKGQLIARLKDSSQQAALRQAKAAYESALAQIPQAKSNLEFQKLSTEAAIQKARAAISAQRTRTLSARQNVQLSSATLLPQSDEYGEGPVSRPATAVALALRKTV